MSTVLKFRRGNTATSNAFTGAEGELFVDTTKDTLVVHDGVTAGGKPLATESYVTSGLSGKADISSLATVATSGSYNDLTNKPTLFSGAYADLTGKPTIPSSTSQLINDSGFITNSSLSGYATESYVTTQINNLIDGAPATLDTLNELAAALGDDSNFASTITNSLATKQNTLISGMSIKTINGESLLGSGNINISGSGGSVDTTLDYTWTGAHTFSNISSTGTLKDKNNSSGTVGQVLASTANGVSWSTLSININITKSSFTGNGVDTDFTLETNATADSIFVHVNGLYYHPEEDYTVNTSTNTLTFSQAPADQSKIRIRYFPTSSATSTSAGDLQVLTGLEDLMLGSGSEDFLP